MAQAQGMGVIAKRPIANVAWQYDAPPANGYIVPYWERFQQLQFPFVSKPLAEVVGIALRFTLSVPGVATAIVGTRTPGRWQQNADLINQGALESSIYHELRTRWMEAANPDWLAKT